MKPYSDVSKVLTYMCQRQAGPVYELQKHYNKNQKGNKQNNCKILSINN